MNDITNVIVEKLNAESFRKACQEIEELQTPEGQEKAAEEYRRIMMEEYAEKKEPVHDDRELALIADNRQQHKLAVKYSNRRFK